MSGKQSQNLDVDGLMMSSGKKSVGQDLDNLDIKLGQQHSDLLVSEIRDDNLASAKKDGVDDIAEMEKLLKSSSAFGGKDLSNTFKKIRGELKQDGQYDEG